MIGPLYVAAYDIREPRIQRRALRYLRAASFDKQKSVFECRLRRSVRDEVLQTMSGLIDPQTDSFLLARLEAQGSFLRLGCAPALPDAHAPLILIG